MQEAPRSNPGCIVKFISGSQCGVIRTCAYPVHLKELAQVFICVVTSVSCGFKRWDLDLGVFILFIYFLK